MRFRRTFTIGALCLPLLATLACGGSTGGAGGPQSSTGAGTSKAAPVVPADVAAPGTKVKLGERAVIPWQDGSVAITVTSVEPGDVAGFRQKFGENAEGLQPYYVRFTMENVGGTDLSGKNPPLVRAALADGSGTGTFITGSVDACESKLTPSTFTTVGAKFDTCVLDAADNEDKVAGARYGSGQYDDKPLLWTR
ncbi:hypothetical protein ORV05_11950 [Amycolatopsis cynarae]|uniref:Lipoprotein n=1 Tax=Amycolatopsis cynarae TaxID=2995223 RepID=A0ABY7B7X6_9PSEU|nr:hypothetical protein [Amycolatopsis sp. HUAS 11-8]WAL68445.1 hypothetical protein ORV05_11950 [Amycolatopsis sp. HUAS 11-8]